MRSHVLPQEAYVTGNMRYIPHQDMDESNAAIRETAKKAYKILGCAGLTRVDFLIDGDSGKIVLNEPNTLTGFTNISMYPKLIMSTGMSYSELIDKLLGKGTDIHIGIHVQILHLESVCLEHLTDCYHIRMYLSP